MVKTRVSCFIARHNMHVMSRCVIESKRMVMHSTFSAPGSTIIVVCLSNRPYEDGGRALPNRKQRIKSRTRVFNDRQTENRSHQLI